MGFSVLTGTPVSHLSSFFGALQPALGRLRLEKGTNSDQFGVHSKSQTIVDTYLVSKLTFVLYCVCFKVTL